MISIERYFTCRITINRAFYLSLTIKRTKMGNNKVLVAVKDRSLFDELSNFFIDLGFQIISFEMELDVVDNRQIVFFVVDKPEAQKLLPYIMIRKKRSETVLPALIFLPDTEDPVKWLENGFDDFLFYGDSSELNLVKLKKWASALKQQQNTIERRESLLGIVAHSLKSPIVIIDQDGIIVAVNQVAIDVFGVDISKVVGSHWTKFTPEEYKKQLEKIYEEIGKGNVSESKCFEFKFKDKVKREKVWQVLVNVDPVSQQFVITMQDIQPVVDSHQALLQSEQKFLSAVESVNEAFSVATMDGIYVDVNTYFLNRLGFSRDEIIGKNDADLGIWQNLSERDRFISALLKDGFVKEMKVVFKDKSGNLIHGIISGRTILLNDKKFVFSSVKDITLLKDMQVVSHILDNIKEFCVSGFDEQRLFVMVEHEFRKFSWLNGSEIYVYKKENDIIYGFQNGAVINTEVGKTDRLLLNEVENKKSMVAYTRDEILTITGLENDANLPVLWIGFPLISPNRYFGSLFVKCKSKSLKNNKQALSLISDIAKEVSFFLEGEKTENEFVVIRHALDSAASAVVITDIDGSIIWVNKAFTTLTGYSFKEAIGQNPRILKSGKHPESFYKKLWDTVLSGKVWKKEIINKRKDGTLYQEENTITPVLDKNGNISRFIAIKQDITKRKKFEEDLKTHLKKQQILNNILSYYVTEGASNLKSIIQFYLTEIGSFVKADRMCLTEYDAEKVEWSRMYQWSANHDEKHILSGLDENELEMVKTWFSQKVEKSSKICSFSTKQVEDESLKSLFQKKQIGTLVCFPLFYEDRRIGFTGFIFSDPDYKMSDDEVNLMDIFSYIIINIWLRNASMKELEGAKQKAEEAVRLKTSFLANMNHEIRTPMNAVMGFSDLMMEASCDEKDDYSKIILKSAKQLLKLIDNVIFLSRLQSEKLPVTLSECKPAEIIDTVFQMFLVSDENVNNLDLRITFPGNLKDFSFVSDVDKIQQVLTNFVSNALKYTLSGHVEIGFAVANDKVRFFVKDTGKGIAKDEALKVFDAFYRTSDVMFSSIRGTGLGLNIAKELVETMGGEIGVDTELNRGSEFYFTLPYKPSDEKRGRINAKQRTSVGWNDLKVLVAEDNDESFFYLKVLLEKRVKILDRADDGLQAIKMAMENDYDLILMDIKMPELNGLDATRHIKLKKPEVKIIAQTAYAMPEEKDQALHLGCDDYITKPVKKEVLYDIIEKKVLGGS